MKELYTSSALNDLHDSPGMKRDLQVKKYHQARQMAVLQGLWLRKRLQRLIRKGRSRPTNCQAQAWQRLLDWGKIYVGGHPGNFKAGSLGKYTGKGLERLLVR